MWYIAGPMRGIENYNYPMFDKASTYLRDKFPDEKVISPADEDRHAGLVDESAGGDVALTADFNIEQVLRKDLLMVMSSNHILLLPGWSQSRGARVEAMAAANTGVDTYLWGVHEDDAVEYFNTPDDIPRHALKVSGDSIIEAVADEGCGCCGVGYDHRNDTDPYYFGEYYA